MANSGRIRSLAVNTVSLIMRRNVGVARMRRPL